MKNLLFSGVALSITCMVLCSQAKAQVGCTFITFAVEQIETCQYRIDYTNANECYPQLRVLISEGSYVSWDANATDGWTATLVSGGEILMTHSSGFIPIGTGAPLTFTLSPGSNPVLSLLWDYTCPPGEGCFAEFQLANCPLPADGCIEGFVYLECGELPFINQKVLSNWTIELLDDIGNVLVSEVTNIDGAYSFCDLQAGNYVVQVRGQPGWTANVPPTGQSTIELNDSEFVEQNFGLCPNCFCKDPSFTDLILHWDNGPGLSIQCETSYEDIPCPEPGSGYFLAGKFECEGDACEVNPYVSWDLLDPSGNNHSGSSIASPYFVINLLPSQISQNGIYTMTLTSFCGTDTCTCEFQFVVECDTLCPCDDETIHALSLAVNQGFATILFSSTCTACFSPTSLTECEKVDWYLNSPGGTPIGSSTPNQSFCYTFQGPGSYSIVMAVTRLKPDGSLCESFAKYQTVDVLCQSGPMCDQSVFRNPTFSEGALEGGLSAGGASDFWKADSGDPIVYQSSAVGSHDSWMILLSGNLDTTDILSTIDPICLVSDTGTISLRLFGEPIPGADCCRCPPPCRSKMFFFQGNSFDPNVHSPENFEIADVPLPLKLDSLGWLDIIIPYDIRNWITNDSCSEGSVANARLAIFVEKDLNTSQGGLDNRATVLLDHICVDGETLAVHEPSYQSPLIIYPNPTGNLLTIEFSNPLHSEVTISVVNNVGQEELQKEVFPGLRKYEMNLEGMSAGLYFLQILSKGQVIAVNKFVKQ
jgi:hypothetical protein